jgi:hypothetical protein
MLFLKVTHVELMLQSGKNLERFPLALQLVLGAFLPSSSEQK